MKRMRPRRGREESWGGWFPGVCDPGLCDGYAPHTLDLLHLFGVQEIDLISFQKQDRT